MVQGGLILGWAEHKFEPSQFGSHLISNMFDIATDNPQQRPKTRDNQRLRSDHETGKSVYCTLGLTVVHLVGLSYTLFDNRTLSLSYYNWSECRALSLTVVHSV